VSEKELPKTAYILLWFPKSSETFIFSEVKNLLSYGLPVSVYTLYGRWKKDLSREMLSYHGKIVRLGVWWTGILPFFVLYWLLRSPVKTGRLAGLILCRRWKGLEKTAENLWACLCGFYLAYRFEKEKVQHIHAPWASGCATAAWLIFRLTDIPFSFTIRAWDIHPPDSLIHEKTRDACFVRSNTRYNIGFLHSLTSCSPKKLHLVYNGLSMAAEKKNPVLMEAPYRLLAVGRLVEKKGYEYLLQAAALLKEQGIDFSLKIVGDGPCRGKLTRLHRSLQLESHVTFCGFQPYEKMPDYYRNADIFVMPCVIHSSGDRDGIPNALMEALVHAVPIISTPVSGIPELIEDGVTGRMVPERDPFALADAIVMYTGDRQKALKMAEHGHKRVLEMFDTERNHKKVLALLTA